MNDYSELKRAAEACKNSLPLRYMESHGSLYIRNDHGIVFDVHQNRSFPEFMAANKAYADLALAANPAAVLALIAENERLQETCNGLDSQNDAIVAENEALRDDLEQAKYDADAWRNQEESVWVQVFLGEGDDPFISAMQGAICIEQISLIQADLVEYAEDYFEKGPGFYVFECRHFDAHYDNVGMTEPAHWEIDFHEFARFPWADEQDAERAAMSKEDADARSTQG